MPSDPFSEEYFNAQMDLYSKISGGKQYSVENEYTEFCFEDRLKYPFPYCTESSTTVGNHLMGIGFLISTMALPPKSNIIEFGAGYGETTYHLAMMGHNLTVVDIGKNYLELIEKRLNNNYRNVKLIHKDMLDYQASSKYDAALFYESFHHCSDPFSFLKNLYRMIKDTGIICFAAEPIIKGFTEYLPYPWGVRLDGMSVWSMRKFGWLELGFEKSFFLETLRRFGFSTEEYRNDLSPYNNIIIARKNKKYSNFRHRSNILKNEGNKKILDLIKKMKGNIDSKRNSIKKRGGWYNIEIWRGTPTCWISNDAILSIYSDENCTMNLTFRALSFYKPRTLEIYSGDTPQDRQMIPTDFINISVQIPLHNGENNIRLYIPEGCDQPCNIPELNNKDTRGLSIAIQDISLQ